MSEDEFTIRELSGDDSLEELTALLHRSYKILADMGLKYLATYQTVDVTKDRIRDGVCFVVEKDKKIIATLTYYPPGISHAVQKTGITDSAWMGQMGVEPEFQRKGVGQKLIAYVEKYASDHGAVLIGLDTSEKASHLIKWYEKLGYTFHSHISWDITNYRSVVLLKRL